MRRTAMTVGLFFWLAILSGCGESVPTIKSLEEIKGKWKVVRLQSSDVSEEGREEFEIILDSGTWRAVVTKDGKSHHVDLSIDTYYNPSVINLLKEGVTISQFKVTLPQPDQMKWDADDYHAVMEKLP